MGRWVGSQISTQGLTPSRQGIRIKAKKALLRQQVKLEPHTVLNIQLLSRTLGWCVLTAGLFPLQTPKRLALRLIALRRFEKGIGLALTKYAIGPWLAPARASVWRDHHIGWRRYRGAFANIAREPELKTSVLLKEPGPDGEKGVLYSAFEYNWMKILSGKDPAAFFRDYYLFGASSWSPSDYAVFASFCGLSRDPVFIGVSNLSDIMQYRAFAPAIQPVPLMACDFTDPDFFRPRPRSERTIDILMVAHFALWKRHWLLFEALRRMPRSLRVVLIGRQGPGRTERELRQEARAFGVKQDLLILSGLEIDQVVKYQCNARLTTLFSKREGSCVAVAEALFADSPVAMMRDSHIGARAHINPQTGRLVKRHNLHHQLSEMLEQSETYSPRNWACQHISAQLSSEKLNGILRDYSLRAGRPWTRDIAPVCRRYVPRYLNSEDGERLKPAVDQLRERHGIVLQEFISEKHARRRSR